MNDVCLSNLRYGVLSEESLSEIFSCSSKIRKLQINIPLSESMLLRLASRLETHTSLEFLGFEYCNETMIDFFKSMGQISIKTIQFSFVRNFVLDEESETVVRDFFSKSCAMDIRFAINEELGLWEARKHVSLLECVVTGLAFNKTMNSLDLKIVNGADLCENSMELLLHTNQYMLSLNITASDLLKEPFVRDFLSALRSSCCPREVSLKNLSCEASAALFGGLASTQMIRSLSVEKFEYEPIDLQRLIDGLRENETISKLTLAAISGGSHMTLNALAPVLSSHRSLQSFQILGHDVSLSSDIVGVVEMILESNPRMLEFGFPIYTANDATNLVGLIPKLRSLESLQIVDGSFPVPLIDPEELLEVLNQNSTIIHYNFVSPKQDHNVRLRSILQRNVQLKRRRKMSETIPLLEDKPQLWPLFHAKMLNCEDWIDAGYHFTRELVLLQRF